MNEQNTRFSPPASDPAAAPAFSAARVAEIMAGPGNAVITPTTEQTKIIEHPLGNTTLVIAGAGSGKTETMANRVVWLVANGLVSPSQVLGLTFTRKAAGELGERISGRLMAFTERLIDAGERGLLSATEANRARLLSEVLGDGLDLPDVSTYNAFASGVVQEFGALAGVSSSATVIDEATAWRIARDVVCESTDPELVSSGDSIARVVSRVIELDHAVSDNLTSFDLVAQVVTEFERVGSLPYNEKSTGAHKVYADIRDILRNMRGTQIALRLARVFAEEKRRRGLIEFSDQLALAVETLERFPKAVVQLRQRTPIVLLDEVQDTSVGQTRLLSMLYAGTSVMAVGDPHQSIYGFRGASADNLRSFHRDFRGSAEGDAVGRGDARPAVAATTLSLSVSWRNPSKVLEVANSISAPLTAASPIDVPRLRSKEEYLGADTPKETPPAVEWRFPETLDEELEQLSIWLREARAEHLQRTGTPATAAVVMRARKWMPAVSEALTRAGVPNRIVGLGGLLTTPEVTEVVSALRCIWFADAGSDLIRLLASPRFRVGAADLAGLRQAASWFAQRDVGQQPLSAEDLRGERVLPDPDRQFTLLDAVDEISSMKRLEHVALSHISETGRDRIREAGQMLRRLRQAVGRDIPSLLRTVEYELRIDIELEANERTGYEGSAIARSNLDAFTDLIEVFLSTDEQGTLASVLAWLERLTELDQAAEHVPEPEPGTVHLITGHGAKGLEWDLVVVPRLVESEFPSVPKEGVGWLRPGKIPDELRGDAAARPKLEWRIATTQAELRERIRGSRRVVEGEVEVVPGYAGLLADRHQEEERRLAYVAVTRAAARLLLTGSFWGGTKTPRGPSPFLTELVDAQLIAGLPAQSEHDEDPLDRPERTAEWPLDPLGARAQAVLAAAGTLERALAAGVESGEHQKPGEPTESGNPDTTKSGNPDTHRICGIDPTVELLLAERDAAGPSPSRAAQEAGLATASSAASEHASPDRLTASTFHEFIEDPEEAERRRIRPIPLRPYRRTRTGNRFHEWVERRATTSLGTSVPLWDLDPEAIDLVPVEFDTEAELQPLIEQFERSRFADRQPIAVELEVSIPFAGRRLLCKLDAVYETGEGDETRVEVVDWKSGRPPKNDAERRSRFLQLDLYRHAYAQWAGIDPERIDVTLFYVAEGQELRGAGNRSLAELELLWLTAAQSLGGPS
ncbi:UvrD-helicase domain-containing protein [Leucobacter sp. W1478]|uniref:UvrD-helicase domain-containing protein n=1 Tax=Leucobacter sp. W1478 TaxID=3439065 RepID=UPI003F39C87A